VKKLPEGRNTIGLGRQRPPISQSIHLDSNQPGAPKRITPIDVDQRKFEGEHDHQLLPMDVDQGVIEKLGTEARKGTTHPGRGEVLKVTNPRAKEGRNSSEMVRKIMKMPFTVTLEEAVNMSPSLRQDLANTSKVQHETLPPGLVTYPDFCEHAIRISSDIGLIGLTTIFYRLPTSRRSVPRLSDPAASPSRPFVSLSHVSAPFPFTVRLARVSD